MLRWPLVHHVTTHEVASHWPDLILIMLLHHHAIPLIHHVLLRTHSTVALRHHWLSISTILLGGLVLHHVVLLLQIVWTLPILGSGLRLSLLKCPLRLSLPVLDLVRLRSLVTI